MSDLEQRVLKFLSEEVPGFQPQHPLLQQLDSLQIIGLIPRLEKAFDVKIASVEITGDAFQSVAQLTRLISAKSARR